MFIFGNKNIIKYKINYTLLYGFKSTTGTHISIELLQTLEYNLAYPSSLKIFA